MAKLLTLNACWPTSRPLDHSTPHAPCSLHVGPERERRGGASDDGLPITAMRRDDIRCETS